MHFVWLSLTIELCNWFCVCHWVIYLRMDCDDFPFHIEWNLSFLSGWRQMIPIQFRSHIVCFPRLPTNIVYIWRFCPSVFSLQFSLIFFLFCLTWFHIFSLSILQIELYENGMLIRLPEKLRWKCCDCVRRATIAANSKCRKTKKLEESSKNWRYCFILLSSRSVMSTFVIMSEKTERKAKIGKNMNRNDERNCKI